MKVTEVLYIRQAKSSLSRRKTDWSESKTEKKLMITTIT